MHLTEEDLIHHYYAERQGSADIGAGPAAAQHLQTCASCRDAWTELTETLKLVDDAPVPNPASGFEQRLWARVRQQMPDRASVIAAPARPRRLWLGWLVPLASAAALIAIVTIAVQRVSRSQGAAPAPSIATSTPSAADAAADARRARERVLLSAAGDHLEQTEVLLVELLNARGPNREDFSYARIAADDLVASSRLYRQTAEQSGDLRLAGVLEDLESVLVEVARSPERIGKKDFESLRARIGDDSLLFKVRAVSNEIRERQKKSLTVAEGAL